MRKFLIISLAVLLVMACNRKALPVISERTTDPPAPESPVANLKPDLVIGQRVYVNRCGKCHDLPVVNKYKEDRWISILKTMSGRAGLSREQQVHVTAYVKANAAK